MYERLERNIVSDILHAFVGIAMCSRGIAHVGVATGSVELCHQRPFGGKIYALRLWQVMI